MFRSRPVAVIRKGDFKLHLYLEEWLLDGGKARLHNNKAIELYNIRTDKGEHTDLSHSHVAQRNELLNELLQWMNNTGAPLPTRITTSNKPVAGNVAGEN
ncbi:hypothetical protein [Niabella hibiscisoli]|uniref:hypothetical protein n=1 Tax=Niabella hibiscisoli TaxID=1825928 RepID=UPI001F110D45|nr:hypothetical protein [Niabella hibiscisoli]MCH5719261.1 hypothetical protein [Niabella hibiscisoli]